MHAFLNPSKLYLQCDLWHIQVNYTFVVMVGPRQSFIDFTVHLAGDSQIQSSVLDIVKCVLYHLSPSGALCDGPKNDTSKIYFLLEVLV